MFLKCSARLKDGKEHRYWSIVENKRVTDGRVIQRHVLYLGEINSSQQASWRRTIDLLEVGQPRRRTVALFAEDRAPADGEEDESMVRLKVHELQLHRPRQWGGCWLACHLYQLLGLDAFWAQRLEPSRKGTPWALVLQTLVAYRFLDPGSEWRLHRHWYDHSAMADLLGEDFRLAADDTLYRCLDRLLKHKPALFSHLTQRWKDLFGAKFDVLLYDLTSTYFESEPPREQDDKRRFGYSRDKRSDCVQVVIGLIVTPEGFPVAYEVLAGNTSDKVTLRSFLQKIESQYGKAERVWLMDRGVPTEAVLAEMRASDPPVYYLVGTPKGRLSKLEAALLEQPWQQVRPGIEVKVAPQENELYLLAQSHGRRNKERAIRRRQLKALWKRLRQLQAMRLSARQLLLKLGEAKGRYPAAWRLLELALPDATAKGRSTFGFALNRPLLRQVRQREGHYLLRTNLKDYDPAKLWEFYLLLTQIEEAFKHLKGDLVLRPIYHQNPERIEAHIFVSFLAYCLHVTLRRRLAGQAPGLTPRAVIEKFKTVQMIDVHLPTSDGRLLILPRYTQPEAELQLLLHTLKLRLPAQPPPRLSTVGQLLHD
jgi:transposase